MITVHHLANSRSQRVLWLLEELDLAYEVRRYERDATTMLAPPALKRIHPLGKSPVLTDGDLTLAETGLIVEYLCATYGEGRLGPPAAPGRPDRARLRWLYWLHYAEGSAMPPLLLRLIFSALPRQAPALLKPLLRLVAAGVNARFITPQLALHIAYWEEALTQERFFAGADFSAADIMMSFPVEGAAALGVLKTTSVPKLDGFLAHIHARPAYVRALARGGAYDLS